MPEMLKSRKNVFWEALLVTILVFGIGFIFGIYIEQIRGDKASINFYESEVSMIDTLAQSMVFQMSNISCSDLNKVTIGFADKIYLEARNLEKFDDSNKITGSVKTLHKKYDLLRTLLWMNVIKSKERCGQVNSVVYLYDYDSQNMDTKIKQTTFSRVLEDLKNKEGNNIILIPIAANQDIATLNYLIKSYNIESSPAIIINEKKIFYDAVTSKEIQNYLINGNSSSVSDSEIPVVIKLN